MNPVRWSDLTWMRKSPAHYLYHRDHSIEPTTAMRIGSAAHAMFLSGIEPALYPGVRRGKEWDAFKAEHAGEDILNLREYGVVCGVAETLKRTPFCGTLLDAAREVPRWWTFAGRECLGTPDVADTNQIVELKVTNDASPHRFPWHAQKMGWLGQLRWYANGLNMPTAANFIVAVEPAPPFACCVYSLTEQAKDSGERLWRSLWEQLRVCEQSDNWPGYATGVQPLDIPDEDVSLSIDGEEIEL